MLELILRNAVSVRVDGVADSFLTPRGAIAGQFFGDSKFYDFEIENDTVYYRPAYRMDSTKGKKCPGGYWIPRKHECRKGMMTPSAKGKMGGVKAALATAAVAGLAAGGVMIARNQMSGGEAKKGLGEKIKDLAGDRRVQIGAGIAGAGAIAGGTALALGKRKKGEAGDTPNSIAPNPGSVDDESNALGKKKEQQQKQTQKQYTVSEKEIQEEIERMRSMGDDVDRETAMSLAQDRKEYRARMEDEEKKRRESTAVPTEKQTKKQKTSQQVKYPQVIEDEPAADKEDFSDIKNAFRRDIAYLKAAYPRVFDVNGNPETRDKNVVRDPFDYEVSQDEITEYLGEEVTKSRVSKESQLGFFQEQDEMEAILAIKGMKRQEDIKKYGNPEDKKRVELAEKQSKLKGQELVKSIIEEGYAVTESQLNIELYSPVTGSQRLMPGLYTRESTMRKIASNMTEKAIEYRKQNNTQ